MVSKKIFLKKLNFLDEKLVKLNKLTSNRLKKQVHTFYNSFETHVIISGMKKKIQRNVYGVSDKNLNTFLGTKNKIYKDKTKLKNSLLFFNSNKLFIFYFFYKLNLFDKNSFNSSNVSIKWVNSYAVSNYLVFILKALSKSIPMFGLAKKRLNKKFSKTVKSYLRVKNRLYRANLFFFKSLSTKKRKGVDFVNVLKNFSFKIFSLDLDNSLVNWLITVKSTILKKRWYKKYAKLGNFFKRIYKKKRIIKKFNGLRNFKLKDDLISAVKTFRKIIKKTSIRAYFKVNPVLFKFLNSKKVFDNTFLVIINLKSLQKRFKKDYIWFNFLDQLIKLLKKASFNYINNKKYFGINKKLGLKNNKKIFDNIFGFFWNDSNFFKSYYLNNSVFFKINNFIEKEKRLLDRFIKTSHNNHFYNNNNKNFENIKNIEKGLDYSFVKNIKKREKFTKFLQDYWMFFYFYFFKHFLKSGFEVLSKIRFRLNLIKIKLQLNAYKFFNYLGSNSLLEKKINLKFNVLMEKDNDFKNLIKFKKIFYKFKQLKEKRILVKNLNKVNTFLITIFKSLLFNFKFTNRIFFFYFRFFKFFLVFFRNEKR